MSTNLAFRIAQKIRERGPLGLNEFMRNSLLDPREGYYASGNPLGRDFTTAPEVSQMFGELIGLWCADGWNRLGMPTPILLVELGPGRGTLISDALRAINKVCPEFANALELHLVEISEPLRRMQADAISDANVRVFWHERLAQVPEGAMLVIANEFFDALPVRQFQYTSTGWRERCIGLADDDETFVIQMGEVHAPKDNLFAFSPNPAPGEVVELRPAGNEIARYLGSILHRDSGVALLVDYGSASQPRGDSFSALCRQGFVDPLTAPPGSADLSAWVDFGSLAKAALEGAGNWPCADDGVEIFGPVPQGRFLRRLGIAKRAVKLSAPYQDLVRLVDPGAMGSVFKVLALAVGLKDGAPPAGFLASERWCGLEDE